MVVNDAVSITFTPLRFRTAVKLFLAVVLFEFVLLALHLFNSYADHSISSLGYFFDLDGEANIPTWFSSAQILATAATIGIGLRRTGQPQTGRVFLTALAGLLLFLSVDEVAGIHEQASKVLRQFESMPRFEKGHGLWVPIYLGVGGLFLLVCLQSLLDLFRHRRKWTVGILGGLAVAGSGGVGLEVLSYEFLRQPGREELYLLEVGIEEFLEMAGITILWWNVLRLLADPWS